MHIFRYLRIPVYHRMVHTSHLEKFGQNQTFISLEMTFQHKNDLHLSGLPLHHGILKPSLDLGMVLGEEEEEFLARNNLPGITRSCLAVL